MMLPLVVLLASGDCWRGGRLERHRSALRLRHQELWNKDDLVRLIVESPIKCTLNDSPHDVVLSLERGFWQATSPHLGLSKLSESHQAASFPK